MASYVDFANSEQQAKIAELMDKGESGQAIAKALGIDPGQARKQIRAIKDRARLKGYDPEHGINRPISDDSIMSMHGMSDMRKNEDGLPVWYKFSKDAEEVSRRIQAANGAFTKDLPQLPEIKPSKKRDYDEDLIPWYQIGDAHLGMLAREAQVGHSFDLTTGERELAFAIASLVERTRPCERCVINDLGDGTHFENEAAVTSHSGHALDSSAPLFDVIDTYYRLMRYMIEAAMQKHWFVDVIINQGNHSRVIDWATATHLRHFYANNKRVTILDNSSVFIPYRMGNTFVLCHHTDKCKPGALAGVMANDFAQDWGETFYHYMDGGHVHHGQAKKEANGAIYESWNQMAPSDKYAHDGGWRSRSFISMVYRSKTYGEKGRETVTAEEVKDKIDRLVPGSTAKKRRKVHTV
jgi:hypothetical protein